MKRLQSGQQGKRMVEYPILPVAKPRMTQRDKWAKRPCVMAYRDFKDHCRAFGVVVPQEGSTIAFVLPMPGSWSEKQRNLMEGMPHVQKPDIDNLLKGLLDAVFDDDSGVYDIRVKKVWGKTGKIIIY